MSDKKVEIVGVHGSFELGAAQVGLANCIRLAQGSRIRIQNKVEMPIQVDGEPCLFPAGGDIEISWKGQSFMLARSVNTTNFLASDIVEYASHRRMINAEQRNELM